MLLRRYPNHGFEEIAQLSIFHNGLKPNTKMILDARTMMVVDIEQAIINGFGSNGLPSTT